MTVLEVYVSENTPNSNLLLRYLEKIKQKYDPDKLLISIIYVNRTPEKALDANILMTPTIIIRGKNEPTVLLGLQKFETLNEIIQKAYSTENDA